MRIGFYAKTGQQPFGKNRIRAIRSALILTFFFGSLTACQSIPKDEAPVGSGGNYANLRQIVLDFSAQSEQQSCALQKWVNREDGITTDTVVLANPKWEQELAAFLASDLSHPRLKGRYKVDSTYQEDTWTVRYRATAGELPLREAVLVRRGQHPVSLQLSDSSNNLMYRSSRNLYLHLDSGYYRIRVAQSSWLFQNTSQQIEGLLRCP